MILGSNPGRRKNFHLQYVKADSAAYAASYSMGNRVPSLKQAAPPSSAEVKNEWSYTSTPSYMSSPRTETTLHVLTYTYVVTVHNSNVIKLISHALSVGQKAHKKLNTTFNYDARH
jgi:hypothetical protein